MKYSEFLKPNTECPFCNRKQAIIEEDDFAYLTLSISPYSKYHMLVIPKKHIEDIALVSAKESESIDKFIKRATNMLKKMNIDDYSVLARTGDKTGRSVPHLHYNIIPVDKIGDLDKDLNDREILTDQEMENIIKELK